MSKSLKVAKTQKSKRALAERAPKLVENTKKALLVKGPKSSDVTIKLLKDIYNLKKPDAKLFTKRNLTRPFEDQSSMEYLCQTNDSSLFSYISHSKKRAHNLVMGRMFDYQILDMIELGVDPRTFKSMSDYEGKRKVVVRVGSKPMFVFQGAAFDEKEDHMKFKSLILDYFRGEVVSKLNLAGLDRVIVCTAHKEKIHFRHYGIILTNSGGKHPNVELETVGPTADFTIRRVKSAPTELQKKAAQTPRGQRSAKRKNKEDGLFGDKMGRVHLGKQNFSEISLAKLKGLKKRKLSDDEEEEEGGKEAGDAAEDSD